jgi:hypothetical protein
MAKITFIFPNFRTVITTEKEFKELREILNKEVTK